jgi:hypothetical protein
MRHLLTARGWLPRDITWVPYAAATASQVGEALRRAGAWSTRHPNALSVIVFDGHAFELERSGDGSQPYAQAWAFDQDAELFSNEALGRALARFALDGQVVVVNDCCYAAGFAVALADAARTAPLPPWVMLSLVALPQATGLTGWEWTARIAHLALVDSGKSYAQLVAATPNVDGVFASSPALLSTRAFSLE